jgi:subtilisin family serine protease
MRKIAFGIFVVGIVLCISPSRDESLGTELSWGYRVKEKDTKENSKLSSRIREVVDKMKSMGVTRSNIQDIKPQELSTPLVKVNESGEIQVYIHVEEVNEENLVKLRALGVKIEIANAKYKIIQGWVPFDKVEEVSNLSFVKKITPPSYGKTRTGSVTTEGDVILGSDDVRNVLGFDGTGVTVGVISDGVDNIAASQATGDLPDNVIIGNPGEGNEGTALMEIIHDIAPGAELAFSSGLSTLEFIGSIDFLISIGADVIVDDLGFLGEPFFEDGNVAKEVKDAVDKGVVFVSAGGNDADQHYQALYVDTDPTNNQPGTGSPSDDHDFGLAAGEASDTGWRFAVPPRRNVSVILQWNDRFGKSSNDYDLFLTNVTQGGIQVDSSTGLQDGNDDPIEIVVASNSTSSFVQFALFINRFSGEPKTLEIFFDGPVIIIEDQFNVPEDSVFGHASVPGVITVGAIPADNPSTIEVFSSQGPVSIFFPSFESRPKPDVVAPDGVSTSASGFDPFLGTSASAPHVAGVVALILDKNPNLTPTEVANALGNTSIDLGQPGFDNIFGFGRVDAFAVVQSVIRDDRNGNGNSGSSCSLVYSSSTDTGALGNLLITLTPTIIVGLRRLYKKRNSLFEDSHKHN